MKKYLLVALVFTLACGSSPTEPSAPSLPSAPTNEAPAPEPVPPPPPTPEPGPVPPTPVPDPVDPMLARYLARTDYAHWYEQALFGDRFEVSRDKYSVWVNGERFDILAEADGVFIAGRDGGRLDKFFARVVNGSEWAFDYNGIAGQASGTMERR